MGSCPDGMISVKGGCVDDDPCPSPNGGTGCFCRYGCNQGNNGAPAQWCRDSNC